MKKIFLIISTILAASCSLFEVDSPYYWLNNVRSYKTLPVFFYGENDPIHGDILTKSQTIDTHDYKKNVLVSANLGQRMFDSRPYQINNYVLDQITANMDGYLYTSGNNINIKEGDVYKAVGEVKMDGKYYMLVSPDNKGNILLVDENGKFLNLICRIYHDELLLPREKALVRPYGLGITQNKEVSQIVDKPKMDFEIKYEGLKNNTMSFSFTDYKNTNSTEGYYQVYSYPQEQELININGVKIRVLDVFPDRVEYMLMD